VWTPVVHALGHEAAGGMRGSQSRARATRISRKTCRTGNCDFGATPLPDPQLPGAEFTVSGGIRPTAQVVRLRRTVSAPWPQRLWC